MLIWEIRSRLTTGRLEQQHGNIGRTTIAEQRLSLTTSDYVRQPVITCKVLIVGEVTALS